MTPMPTDQPAARATVFDVARLKPAYWRLRAFLASPRAALATRLRPLRCRLARANAHRVFAVNLNNDRLGFFANLNFCLPFLAFCDEAKLIPFLSFTSPNYLDSRYGPCWFQYFFENAALPAADLARVRHGQVRVCEVRSSREMGLPKQFNQRYYATITLHRANELLLRYVQLRPAVVDKVNAFAALHFTGKTPIAVHFRGTDKALEAPRVAWDYCLSTVTHYLAKHPEVDSVFVASDEQAFVGFLASSLPQVKVCHHADHHASVDGRPVHLSPHTRENYFRGEDALINCLLLSRCTALIKSSSLLSAWACVFNPQLPVIMLNRPHKEDELWFPETELVRRSMDQYLPSA